MRYSSPLLEACFISRPNRFLGIIEHEGVEKECFIPNPGRMKELLHSGAKIFIQYRKSERRRTKYDLILVEQDKNLISIDSRLPNILTAEAVSEGTISEFRNYKVAKAEYTRGDSRLDFLLEGKKGKFYVEVKSCTLVKGNVALFPDAPTKRGSKHLRNLKNCLAEGRAAILIIIQRHDAKLFMPNIETDQVFSETLREVSEAGVEVYAYTCRISSEEARISEKIPVKLV